MRQMIDQDVAREERQDKHGGDVRHAVSPKRLMMMMMATTTMVTIGCVYMASATKVGFAKGPY